MPEVDAFIGTSQINDITTVADAQTSTRARSPCCRSAIRARPTSTTSRRRACSPRPAITPTSRSPKAATARAPSASSRRCAATFAAAASARSSPRRSSWPKQGVKEMILVAQDSSRYGEDLGEQDALAHLMRELCRHRRRRVGARDVHLSDAHQRRLSRRAGRRAEGRQVSRHAFAARLAERSEADEARREPREPRTTHRARARARAGDCRAHDLHHRLPRRDRRGLRGAAGLRQERRVRPRRRLHLLGRGGHAGLRPARQG